MFCFLFLIIRKQSKNVWPVLMMKLFHDLNILNLCSLMINFEKKTNKQKKNNPIPLMIRRNVRDVVIIYNPKTWGNLPLAYVRGYYTVAYCHRCTITPYRGILQQYASLYNNTWCHIVISNMAIYIWQSYWL